MDSPAEQIYPASANQKRMVVLDQLSPAGVEYNVPVAVRLAGSLDVARLRSALSALVARHAALRTAFAIEGDEVVQRVMASASVSLSMHAARSEAEIDVIRKAFVRRFDLRHAPLFRACLVRLGPTDHVLLLDLHHIICDGVSIDILLEDLGRLYDGQTLAEPDADYIDFVRWQRSAAGAAVARAQEEYWLGLLGEDRPASSLPADLPRAPVRSFDGDRVFVPIPRELAAALRSLAARRRASMYMLLLAAYDVLLSKYSGQEDVMVGTLVAGRRAEQFRGVVGLFVNTLVLRSRPGGALTFAEYLQQVRGECLAAFENQDYQFEDLVERLAPPRDLGRNPLFDTMFSALIQDERARSYGGVTFSRHELGYDISKFDLSLTVLERRDHDLVLEFEYCTAVFRRATVERMAAHYLKLLGDIAADPDVRLSRVELLTSDEVRSLPGPAFEPGDAAARLASVVELFEEQVHKDPSAPAVSFENRHMSYGELGRRARAVAAALRERGVRRRDLVGVIATPSAEMIVAVLGVLELGAAYLPVDPAMPIERFRTVVADSGMSVLLLGPGSPALTAPGLTAFPVRTDGPLPAEDGLEHAPIDPDDLAYVIYTSGSTGTPKGVMISHRALSNYTIWATRAYIGGEQVSFALHSPLSVDLTVTSVFAPLVSGNRIVIYRGEDPLGLMRQIIARNEVQLLKVTPTHLSLLAEALNDVDARASCLRRLIVGGEDLKTSLAARVHAALSGRVQIINEYGPTEATVGCTAHIYDPETDTNLSVPIGHAIDRTSFLVLDRHGVPVPAGVTGELHVAGVCLANGYLNDPRLTGERFAAHDLGPARLRMYRTGDLVRISPAGQLEYLGRDDDQVKIRGFRIELGEIEANLLRLPGVREAVVTRRTDAAGDACLCAYVVADGEVRAEELRKGLAERLPAAMIPTWFVPLDRLPVARGGKVDRRALPDPREVTAPGRPYAPPRSPAEHEMAAIWKEVLAVDRVGIDDDFFELGGQSLKATIMAARVNRRLRASISLRDVFAHPVLRELVPLVERDGDPPAAIEPVPDQEHHSASSAQKRLYILHQLAPADIQYNVPWAIRLRGRFDAVRWEECFRALVARHESLHTSFTLVDDEIVQRVHPRVDFAFEHPAASGDLQDDIERFVRPFDLGRAPLIRAAVVGAGPDAHAIIVDMHHIVSDGISARILLEELLELYRGRIPELPAVQYKDYAAWQRASARSDALQAQAAYWARVFEGELPVLNLPTDFPRGAIQSFAGDVVRFQVGAGTVEQLRALRGACGATMHMILLAAYTILLSKYAGQEDIVVGTPVAGRNHSSLQRVVGMFVNTLAMRNRPRSELTFREFLRAVRDNALDAYENQDYQFEELVAGLAIERDLARNPLFDAVFGTIDREDDSFELDGVRVELVDFDWKISKFDLTLLAAERGDQLELELEYCTGLFRKETIERLGAHYRCLLERIGREPDRKIADLDPLTDEEREQLLVQFNRTGRAYEADRGVHELFEDEVERRPDGVAVVSGDASLSYRELNRRANQIARALVSRGVAPEGVVGIMAAPSVEMIAGILGILKAGCAYLPIDRDCPEDRGRAMLQDSGAKILLLAGGAGWRDPARDVLDLGDPRLYDADDSNLRIAVGGRALAYVIYTSGTTGAPKGVMVEHHSVNNLCAWHNARFQVTAADRATKYARFSFDASVWEIFPYLQAGAALHVIDERIRLDLPRLHRYFEDHGITIAFLPTQVCELFLELQNRSLRVLLTGGDRLRRLQPTSYRVVNNYGPTESSVVTTSCTVTAGEERISIGRPIDNTRVYILGRGGELVPIGVPGELCVAGAGLARAYLRAPSETAAKFVANPFEPGGRMYRTGDLARWLPDGTIEYIGRTDKQVKIRGCRIEPREIEATVLASEAVRDAVVVAREDSQHNKLLCAYVVWRDEARPAELRAHLARHLPDYMVPAFVVSIDRIPLNATGKVDARKLPCPEGDASAARSHTAARSDAERRLAEIWSRVLERRRVGVHDNFFEIGGDSLRATVMLARANREFGAAVALGAVFDHPTIAALARCFEHLPQRATAPIVPVEPRPCYATTPTQALLHSVCSSVKGVEYNLPMAFELLGELDVARLERAFRRLIGRHESLRTSFRLLGGRVVAVVSPTVDFAMEILDECGEDEIDEVTRDFIRPFQLDRPPLMRAALLPVGPRRHVLLIDVHHLVSDGTSMGILFREMAALYEGHEPPPPPVTFKDFAEWLGGYLRTAEPRAQEEYWRGVLADPPPLLRLDIDYPRPERFTFAGGRIAFQARPDVHAALKALCARQGVTLYMVLLAAYNVLLSKYTRQEDMLVAVPTSGRYLAEVQDVIGMFVSTHVVRSRPRARLRFDELLQQVKASVRGALEHQQYQLWDMLIGHALRTGGKPLFSTVFVVQDQAFTAMEMPGLEVRELDPGYHVSKFDLTVGAVERDDGLHFEFEYNSDVFRRSSARRIAGCYLHLLEQIVADPTQELRALELLTPPERSAILASGRGGGELPAAGGTVLELFGRRAAERPDQVAVFCGGERMSYGELDRLSNRLARRLRGRGIAAGDVVALMLSPSSGMIAAILAVWKAGAAYVPLSPAWPRARADTVAARTGVRLVLRDRDLRADESDDAVDSTPGPAADGDALAYVTERGATIDHRALLDRCRWYIDRFGVRPDDRSAKYGDLAASATPLELFPFLASGASVCVAPASGGGLDGWLRESGVTIAWLPAPWCERLAAAGDTALRVLITSGWNVRPSMTGAYELVRCAGPAENTEVTTCATVRGDGRGANLGRPVGGAEVYVIGHDGGLQPVGVTGELCVGGAGLARAYVGDCEHARGRFALGPGLPGAAMYCTGESARWLPDGTLERTGPAGEVSIDGHRVSLSEIARCLESHRDVDEAVVVFDDEDPCRQRLVAFLVLSAGGPPPPSFVDELKAQLAKRLPAWSVPDAYLRVAMIPRDADGRVQVESLPLPPAPTAPSGDESRAHAAGKVASIAGQVLAVSSLGSASNLFDAGMSSLTAMELAGRLRTACGVPLEVGDVLAAPTIAGISQRIQEALQREQVDRRG